MFHCHKYLFGCLDARSLPVHIRKKKKRYNEIMIKMIRDDQ